MGIAAPVDLHLTVLWEIAARATACREQEEEGELLHGAGW
jgi:hypothetical protein